MSVLLLTSELPVNVIGWQCSYQIHSDPIYGCGWQTVSLPGLLAPKRSHFEVHITINYSCFTVSALYVVFIVMKCGHFMHEFCFELIQGMSCLVEESVPNRWCSMLMTKRGGLQNFFRLF